MTTHYLYVLYSSANPEEYRYVGVSKNPVQRLSQHISGAVSGAKFSENPHKCRWILNEMSLGNVIKFSVLKQFDTEDAAYSEEEWLIPNMLRWGHSLTNIARGGRGAELLDPSRTLDIRNRGQETRRSAEFRNQARDRATKQYESAESREVARTHALRGWETRDRTAWNKGLSSSKPRPPKMVLGSEEHREHARKSTTKYFEELRQDSERYEEYKKSRLEVGKKVSSTKKKEWETISDEERKSRGHKMSLGKRYNRAKRNGWTLDLTPVQHNHKDPK